jgi:hypothetical protein
MFSGSISYSPNDLKVMTHALDAFCASNSVAPADRSEYARRILILFNNGVTTKADLLEKLSLQVYR